MPISEVFGNVLFSMPSSISDLTGSKIGGVAALVVYVIIMSTIVGLSYYFSGRRSTDRMKSRRTGDGQHGSARFATEKEKRKMFVSVPFRPDEWRRNGGDASLPQGIVVGTENVLGKRTAFVDAGDVHALMIGAAGVGKTAFFLYPNLEYACASGMSFLATDTKGDLYRHYGKIARDCYGYAVSVLDLRNPTRSDSFNFLSPVNRSIDRWKADRRDVASRASAEKYAKIISKTIVQSGAGDKADFGQNAFFYDAAEGMLTSVILLVAEFARPEERHIVSVYRVVQELMQEEKPAPGTGGRSAKGGRKAFSSLLENLPETHKARWFAGAAMYAGENAMNSVMSTAMSRLNAFLDSELEQILCFDDGTAVHGERMATEKTALFVVLPEEDNTKYFLASLLVQQLYRELLVFSDENGGRLPRRTMFYLDEFGTIPKIESAEMMFSASRSRRLSIVSIIQSFAQLEKNYGKEGCEIITDNTQLTVFGGFAPLSSSADRLSSSLGKQTVSSGYVTVGNGRPSSTVQMVGRDLLSADEMRVLPKGTFLIAKTGCHPVRQKLPLYLDWGITFPEEDYAVPERASRPVSYAGRRSLRMAIEEAFVSGTAPDFRSRTDAGGGSAKRHYARIPRIRSAAVREKTAASERCPLSEGGSGNAKLSPLQDRKKAVE